MIGAGLIANVSFRAGSNGGRTAFTQGQIDERILGGLDGGARIEDGAEPDRLPASTSIVARAAFNTHNFRAALDGLRSESGNHCQRDAAGNQTVY